MSEPTEPPAPCCQSVFEALAAFQSGANVQRTRVLTELTDVRVGIFNTELDLITTQVQTYLTEALKLCKPQCCTAYADAVSRLGVTTLTQYADILLSPVFPNPALPNDLSGFGNLEVYDNTITPILIIEPSDPNTPTVIYPAKVLNEYLESHPITSTYTQAQKDALLIAIYEATFTGNRFLYQAKDSFDSSIKIMNDFAVCPPSSLSSSDLTQCYELDKKKKCRKTKSKKTKKCKPCGN